MTYTTTAMLALAILPALAHAQAGLCEMDRWLRYADAELRRQPATGAYMFATDRASIDADGSPNAYHPDDVGQACSAVGLGMDCPANASYPTEDTWRAVLAVDPADGSRPFVQQDGQFAGYFVSKTALFDRSNPVEHDPGRYLDASSVPYFVFPRSFYALKGTGQLGDIGFALHTATRRSAFFLIGDIGPDEPLGEGSIALFEALGGSGVNARNGSGVAGGISAYVVFPGSSRAVDLGWPISAEQLALAGEALLETIGGPDAVENCLPLLGGG
jgi:hypothetical protein